MNDRRSSTDFLALRRNIVLLLVALVLAGTGERLWLGFAPKYLETLGAGVLVIGLFDALQTLLGAVYAYPGGWLTDHWGQRRSLLLLNALSLAGYVLVLFWQHWLALVVGAFLFLVERVVVARHVRCRRVLTGQAPAHDGHWRAVDGAARAHDGRPAGRRLAHHALRLGAGRALRLARLHHV